MAQAETIQQQRTSERRPWEAVDVLRGKHDGGYENVPQFSEIAKFDEHEESLT
jgi:hypothetical protein